MSWEETDDIDDREWMQAEAADRDSLPDGLDIDLAEIEDMDAIDAAMYGSYDEWYQDQLQNDPLNSSGVHDLPDAWIGAIDIESFDETDRDAARRLEAVRLEGYE